MLLRVRYTYERDGPAAGNVAQVVRLTPVAPDEDPMGFEAAASCFTYNHAAELWIVTQRTWDEAWTMNGNELEIDVTDVVTHDIAEFRGNGRPRTMVRHRDVSDGEPEWDSAVWTFYDGQTPVSDYTSTLGEDPVVTYLRRYEQGLAQFDGSTWSPTYFMADHLGTTRFMTDANGDLADSLVFTAFGDPVSGSADTRYGFAGLYGYESFTGFDWRAAGEADPVPFEFLHVGHRWYDPGSGRFLQRDPLGVAGGANVYEYVFSNPVLGIDPFGLHDYDENGLCHCHRDYYGHRRYAGNDSDGVELAKLFLSCTPSWLDNPKSVRKAQRRLKAPATCIIWIAPQARATKLITRGITVLGWIIDEFRDWFDW